MSDSNEDLNSFASEHSFVILGQGSLMSDVNDTTPAMNSNQYGSCCNSDSGSLHKGDASQNTRPTSPSSIGVQSKLDCLAKENFLLKETLNHSNIAMKNQFDTLALWHEEIVKTHESHKQKFQETQDVILKLQNENIGLKKLIQQNLDKCIANNQTPVCVDKEGMSASMKMEDVKSKQVNFNYGYMEELRLKNTEMERKLHDITEEKLELEKELKRLIEENARLKSCDKPNYDKCNRCHGAMNSETVKNSDVEERSVCKDSLSPAFECISILGSAESDLGSIEMKEEIALMKQRLADGLKSWEENNKKMKELTIQNEGMKKIKDELENELKSYKIDVEKLKEDYERFSQESKKKDDLLESKQNELEEAINKIKELESACEKIPILEVQVELYKKDFNEERAAREEAIAEKEKFAELVRSSIRLQQNEEKKKSEQSSSSSESKEEVKSYPCPKCWIRFSKPEDCEEHVYNCLNLDCF